MPEQCPLSLQFFAPDARTLQCTETEELCRAIKVAAGQVRLAPGPNRLGEDA
jgi:hypothetical protein